MTKLYLSGMVLGAATLVAALASAQDRDISRVPDDGPVASAADASVQPSVPPAPSSVGGQASKSLNIDLKLDADGFKVGGRLAGSKGVSSGWLGAKLRDDGVTLDGRLEGHDGAPRDFKLNLDLQPGWVRTAARLWLLLH